MRFAHYYPAAAGPHTGVVDALARWANALGRFGQDVAVVHAGGEQTARFDTADLRVVRHRGRGRAGFVPVGFGAALDGVDVLVLHEAWTSANVVAAAAARRRGVPYVVMPHGVFEPAWVATLRPPRGLRAAIERWDLRGARAAHVFFDREAADVHAFAPGLPCVVAPTGFDVPDEAWRPGGDYLVWLGRYAMAHKGLDLMLRGLADLPAADRPKLVMRGMADEDDYAACRRLVTDLGLQPWVEVGPAVWGEEKRALMLGAAGYLHTARWDCHPGVLAEALSLGVPTLVSDRVYAAPEITAAGAALVISPRPAEIADGITRLLGGDHQDLSRRARDFVARQFDWDRVVPRYVDDLERLLAG